MKKLNSDPVGPRVLAQRPFRLLRLHELDPHLAAVVTRLAHANGQCRVARHQDGSVRILIASDERGIRRCASTWLREKLALPTQGSAP